MISKTYQSKDYYYQGNMNKTMRNTIDSFFGFVGSSVHTATLYLHSFENDEYFEETEYTDLSVYFKYSVYSAANYGFKE